MKRMKIGVLGGHRGNTMIQWCVRFRKEADIVAICDFNKDVLDRVREDMKRQNYNAALYDNFDDFIQCDMDAVVLANYANEHAPFAIRCLERGMHVLSEVLPVQTLREAVLLAEAVEKSGKKYVYAENYCYFPSTSEMRRLYKSGELGEIEYGEGEYIHDCESIWPGITYGDPAHWRNHIHALYYCTHSAGPLIHITGLRPVRVTGFELKHNEKMFRMGCKAGQAGIEMAELENGALIKSMHATQMYTNSVWYSLYGTKGEAESERENSDGKGIEALHLLKTGKDGREWARYSPVPYAEPKEGKFGKEGENSYTVKTDDGTHRESEEFGHGGSDFYVMENFLKAIRGEEAEVIDVYEALDMAFVGLFGYFSVLAGGKPMDIPDFRDPAQREPYRNDTRCTDPKVAGDQLIPSYSKGDISVPPENYERIRKMYEDMLAEG